jgi:hypothetical protein
MGNASRHSKYPGARQVVPPQIRLAGDGDVPYGPEFDIYGLGRMLAHLVLINDPNIPEGDVESRLEEQPTIQGDKELVRTASGKLRGQDQVVRLLHRCVLDFPKGTPTADEVAKVLEGLPRVVEVSEVLIALSHSLSGFKDLALLCSGPQCCTIR